MTVTTPTSIDQRIAKLQAKRDFLEFELSSATVRYENSYSGLLAQIALVDEDVEALRALPRLVAAHIKIARQYHRVVTGQRLKRQQESLPGLDPEESEGLA